MKVAFIGLGKLGRPVALAVQSRGHSVVGYDLNGPAADEAASAGLPVRPLADVVAGAEIVFVAVQTPHGAEYEGTTRLPADRQDFDYTHLVRCVRELRPLVTSDQVVAVVSTVLPGTMERKVFPELPHCGLCYNPSFIAMGTVQEDFLRPEFVLLGVDQPWAADRVEAFYRQTVEAPIYRTSVRNAELIKVAYNTFIGMKIVFANTLMEICHKTGCDVDAVTGALRHATRRLISPMYLSGGLGDGGGCHPRDNIALSWLARKLGLSFDLFEAVMTAREQQTDWLAAMVEANANMTDLPVVILGTAFKPQVASEEGSPAILLKRLLSERGVDVTTWDPYINDDGPPTGRAVFVIGTKHREFHDFIFSPGSVVIDPWRYLSDQPGVFFVRVGAAGP